jgi:hypothetical protein
VQHQVDHGQADHRFAALRTGLVILAEPTILAQPREGAFHNPAFGQHHEPARIVSPDDLDCAFVPTLRILHQFASVPAIRPQLLQSLETTRNISEHPFRAIAILHIASMHRQADDQAQRIHDQMTLSPRDFLARIVAVAPPFWGAAVLMLWLSMMPAEGVGLRPLLRRTRSRKRS